MSLIHRFYAALLGMVLAFLTACNPAPLSVVASDFSIHGVKGTSTNTTTVSASTSATTAATKTAASTTTATSATSSTAAASNTNTATNNVQNVTIDLTSTETCTNFTSLVAKVELDEGVKISPNPSVARDYSNPVAFTVTDTYGTKVGYSLTVKGKACATTTKTSTIMSATPTCAIASVGSTGYSLVFKACDADNVATYFDKTECLRDNATSLIWEGKTSAGLRAVDNKYNNLDNTNLLQIAANTAPSTTALPARSPTQVEIDVPDNTVGYKNNVNALGLCGSNRWRLPTLTELQSIRLPGATTQIDLDWFATTNFNGYYATSTQFGTQVERSSVIQFYEKGTATVNNLLRDGTVWDPTLGARALREHSVRLVRSAF